MDEGKNEWKYDGDTPSAGITWPWQDPLGVFFIFNAYNIDMCGSKALSKAQASRQAMPGAYLGLFLL